MEQPLISVIIPVYNVQSYLNRCVDSVLGQTYQNLDVILVNDGSTDHSATICDDYQANDSRVKVIHKQNSGVADTRMQGLALSTGEYYCFLDSDDHIDPDYIKELYGASLRYDADIACCSYLYEYSDGSITAPNSSNQDENYTHLAKGSNILEDILYGKSDFQPSYTMKLFKRSAISEVIFPHYKVGEDFMSALDFYTKAKKVIYINKNLYYYYQNDQSVMHSDDPEKYYERVRSADEIYAIATRIDPTLHKAAAAYLMEMNMIVLMKLQNSDEKEKISHIAATIKKHRKTVLFDKKAKPRIRISCLVSLFGIRFLCTIRNLTTK